MKFLLFALPALALCQEAPPVEPKEAPAKAVSAPPDATISGDEVIALREAQNRVLNAQATFLQAQMMLQRTIVAVEEKRCIPGGKVLNEVAVPDSPVGATRFECGEAPKKP